ncbi:JmjC domain-containing protein [Saccharothrix sp. ST-888]|uniref:JmjC domain-containing protein n=1 Tax=Saccharothrix sp. ST-888 TaxID=1427391 RepID=UPI000B217AEB|nr:cupin domain-containing protein [Saccharothrix sp. ST-888]
MLKTLIDNADEVLARWPEQPQRYRREPSAFEHLLTLAEVDRLIDAECLAMRNLALIKDSSVVEKWMYADGDMPRKGSIRAHLDAGGTISVRSLERLVPSIADLHRSLQEETGYGVHINAYLTPAGHQGLKYHFDPYVTLILQLSGSKAWPVHEPFVENPVKEYASFHTVGFTVEQKRYLANTPPAQTFTLEPGDVLWLPRGYVHSPYTVGDESSLHLTVAFKERTYHWVAEQLAHEVLAQALVDPAMREWVQPIEITRNPSEAIRQMRAYLIGAFLKLDAAEAAQRVQEAALRPL